MGDGALLKSPLDACHIFFLSSSHLLPPFRLVIEIQLQSTCPLVSSSGVWTKRDFQPTYTKLIRNYSPQLFNTFLSFYNCKPYFAIWNFCNLIRSTRISLVRTKKWVLMNGNIKYWHICMTKIVNLPSYNRIVLYQQSYCTGVGYLSYSSHVKPCNLHRPPHPHRIPASLTPLESPWMEWTQLIFPMSAAATSFLWSALPLPFSIKGIY
jgi:hypothetical protein